MDSRSLLEEHFERLLESRQTPSADTETREALDRCVRLLETLPRTDVGAAFASVKCLLGQLGAGGDSPIAHEILKALCEPLARPGWEKQGSAFDDESINTVEELYRQLGESSPSRYFLLRALAGDGSRSALGTLAELLVSDPPQNAKEAALALVPLFQNPNIPVDAIFPRLLDGLSRPAVAVSVLDLANYITRQRWVSRHPAAGRTVLVQNLLRGTTQHMLRIEERTQRAGDVIEEEFSAVAEGVPLMIALCDSAAQIGDKRLVGQLIQALDVGHRHVRAEAASALARLNEHRGIDTLVGLAGEPAVRSRVLAYLAELNQLEAVPASLRSSAARAEGDFVAWLADPHQFGFAPSEVSCIDSRWLPWPGYDERVECYLFSYTYSMPTGVFTGVGLAGPVTFSFPVDLSDLPPVEVYAAFAGWNAEHEEIVHLDFPPADRQSFGRYRRQRDLLADAGFGELQLEIVGRFFGEIIVIASGSRNGIAGLGSVYGDRVRWYPTNSSARPLRPEDVYNICKGRLILGTFDPELYD